MIKNTNKNRSQYLHSWRVPVAILLVGIMVFFAYDYQTSTMSSNPTDGKLAKNCHFSNDSCSFSLNQQHVTARFSEHPQPEESVTLTLRMPEGTIIESAWIEGVNMYMGKVPVLLEKQEGDKWTGWFMLGSCSEPTMNWQVRLNIAGENAPVYMYFTTQ
jgi:hypothetical protein